MKSCQITATIQVISYAQSIWRKKINFKVNKCVTKAPAIIECQILVPIIPKTNLDQSSSLLFISNLNSICS